MARWLPTRPPREWFLPSLHNLECTWAERRRSGSSPRRGGRDLRLAAGAVLLWVECLRLVAILAVQRRHSAHRHPRHRREYLAMIARDLRHALRLFRHDPVFTGAAVLTLALGIGANTALFAIVEAVLLRPLPFASDEVVMLRYRDTRTGLSKDYVALGDVIDLRSRQQSFEAIVPFNSVQAALLGETEAVRVEGITAGPELFTALRAEPLLGRFFEPGDLKRQRARYGDHQPCVVGHAVRFGAGYRGPIIQLGNTRRLVVGVAPKGFRFPPAAQTDIIVPMPVPAAAPAERRDWTHAMGRLRPHVTAEAANAELATLSRQFESEFPATNSGIEYDVQSVRDAMVGDTKRALLLLLGAVGFVLLIACANVGNLLIARSLARRNEMTIRLALGAGRGTLVAQMLLEGLVLAAAGGVTGVLLAWKAAPALAAIVPQQGQPIPGLEQVSINPLVLAFSCGVSLVAALLFSGLAGFGLTGSTAEVVLDAAREHERRRAARRIGAGGGGGRHRRGVAHRRRPHAAQRGKPDGHGSRLPIGPRRHRADRAAPGTLRWTRTPAATCSSVRSRPSRRCQVCRSWEPAS